MDKKSIAVNLTGIKAKEALIVPGTTVINGVALDKYVNIKVVDISLTVAGAATVSLFTGDTEIFRRVLTGAGSISDFSIDLGDKLTGAKKTLSMSISTAVLVTGIINWEYEYAGGNRKRVE